MTSILIAGVGGQGSIFAARVLGLTAIRQGLRMRGSETIGMAQRGGGVVSHVRVSGGEIASPLIPPGGADVLIALEPAECLRNLQYLCKDGLCVYSDRSMSDHPLQPIDAAARVYRLDGEAILSACGAKSLNVALLGAAAKLGAFPFGIAELEETLRHYGRPQFAQQNMDALHYGAGQIN